MYNRCTFQNIKSYYYFIHLNLSSFPRFFGLYPSHIQIYIQVRCGALPPALAWHELLVSLMNATSEQCFCCKKISKIIEMNISASIFYEIKIEQLFHSLVIRIVPGTLVNKPMDIEFQGNVESKATMTVLKHQSSDQHFCDLDFVSLWSHVPAGFIWYLPLNGVLYHSLILPEAHTIMLQNKQFCTGFFVMYDKD